METMEDYESLSSSEAPRAPALDSVQGLSIPVAGPEAPFRPTSGMPAAGVAACAGQVGRFTERLISSELRGAGFNLQEVIPPELELAAQLGRRTRGTGLRQLEGVGRKRFVLSSDDDNELRSRCE